MAGVAGNIVKFHILMKISTGRQSTVQNSSTSVKSNNINHIRWVDGKNTFDEGSPWILVLLLISMVVVLL